MTYDAWARLDHTVPTVYVDFAGNATLRRRVHEHFAAALAYSSSIGGTHWEALGSGAQLPGPRPTLFFAPAQVKTRSGPPPDGWGPGGLQQRLAQAWQGFMHVVDADGGWLRVENQFGSDALQAAYHALLAGRADPSVGLMLSLHQAPA